MKPMQLRTVLLAITALGLLVWGAAVTIPNTFTNGDIISASQMNANFAAVKAAVDANESAVATLKKGPTVHYTEDGPGGITVDGTANLCQTTAYTAGANERAIVSTQVSLTATTTQSFSGTPFYSADGGTTFTYINGWFSLATIPANGWTSVSTTAAMDLTQGSSYVFAVTPQASGGSFSATSSRCHVTVQIVPRDSAQTLSILSGQKGDQ